MKSAESENMIRCVRCCAPNGLIRASILDEGTTHDRVGLEHGKYFMGFRGPPTSVAVAAVQGCPRFTQLVVRCTRSVRTCKFFIHQ